MGENRRTVLVVEDSDISREMLEVTLESAYRVISCSTVREAREVLAREPEGISVVLLDLNLPDMYGLDFLRELREDPKISSIPVLVLTVDKEAEVRSFEAGAVDFIPKPYPMPEVIHARVRRSIELSENNMLGDVRNMSNTSVAEALSSDYICIYYVNVQSGRFIEYSASEEYRRLGIESSGEDFFGLSRQNMARVVHKDDRDMFLDAFTKDKVLSALASRPTFTMTYRLILDGAPRYVHMKVNRIREQDGTHVVIGISNIDEQVRAKEAFERVRNESATFSRIAQALAQEYVSIHYVNMENDTFIEYSSDASFGELGIEKEGEDFFGVSEKNTLRVIAPEDQDAFLRAINKDNIVRYLEDHKISTLAYRLMLDGRPTWMSMKTMHMEGEDDSEHIIVAVSNIDEQMRQQERLKKSEEERITYSRIAQALSGDFFSIYVYDPKTKNFQEYAAEEERGALGLVRSDRDFFAQTSVDARAYIYPDDCEMFLSAFNEESLLDALESRGVFTLKYRMIIDGVPTWVSMKATMLEEDGEPLVIIGVNNIDAQVRREQEFDYNLSVAREKAYRDPLTGVKSKHAFLEKLQEMNATIARGEQGPFSVVMCDVNGLKGVNDSLGHAAGDELIREAAAKICRTFKHSPVYRVGGDEFAVVSEGSDCENAVSLVEGFRGACAKNASVGGVVVACGLAIYTDQMDFDVVFREADADMYENKKLLKQ